MRLIALSALAMLAVDQASKWAVVWGMNLIERGMVEVWPPFLVFRMGWNTGVNFGLMSGANARWALIVLALAICAWAVHWVRHDRRALVQVSAGLLVGGALGNVIDRIAYGAVADFLNMSCCGISNPYTFNLADVGIFAGAIGLLILSPDPNGTKET